MSLVIRKNDIFVCHMGNFDIKARWSKMDPKSDTFGNLTHVFGQL